MLAGLVILRAVREDVFHAPFLTSGGLLAIFGVPWLVEASPDLGLHIHMLFSLGACPCSNFPFL